MELNALPIYHDQHIETKIRTCDNKVYTNFCVLNVPEDEVECESFANISTDSELAYEHKYYLMVYLKNCGLWRWEANGRLSSQ